MKANELMIGDWVMYRNTPRKVVYIYCRPLPDGSMPANEIGFTHDEDEWINADHISPIPLTAEILEKNGFWFGLTTEQEDIMECGLGVPVTPQKSWVWENEDDAVVCVDFPNENDGGQVWCNNHEKTSTVVWKNNFSVHELQHALRLCGLTDMADNFQLPELPKEDTK